MPGLTQQGLEQRVAVILNRWPAVGLAVGVVRRGSPTLLYSHGVANVADRTPATEHTVFRIGSITKTFTGFVVSRLVQQNTVTWETSIQDVFPNIGSEQGIQPAYPPKMLAELMTHQADFPRDGDEGTICDTSNFTDYRCACVRASCSRRADWSGFFDRLSERTLTATSRPSLMSRARYTSPMPPAPRSASTSSEPSRWPGLSAMF